MRNHRKRENCNSRIDPRNYFKTFMIAVHLAFVTALKEISRCTHARQKGRVRG